MRKGIQTFIKPVSYLFFLLLLSSCKKDAMSIETRLQSYSSSLQFEFLPESIEKVFYPQTPWESRGINYYNVMQKDSNLSMWYTALGKDQHDFEGSFCVANSRDGKNWDRPQINNNTNVLISGNNASGITGTFVFFDDSDNIYPYKMICSKLVDGKEKTFLYSSPDGKAWKKFTLLYNQTQDSQFGIVKFEGRYYVFSRYNDYTQGYQRAVGLSILDKDLKILQPPLLLLRADANSSFPHIYNNAASKINDSTILLFPTFYNSTSSDIRIKLIYTNNLKDYYLVDDNITNKLFPGNNVNWAIVSPGVIPTGEKNTYWVYYLGTQAKHGGFANLSQIGITYYRIKLVIH
jgi:hypothetical protein